jgi:hypothetical protein
MLCQTEAVRDKPFLVCSYTHGFIRVDARQDTTDVKSAADLSPEYKTLRDNSPNMHQNADSYRVFAALCGRGLRRRALTEEDPVSTNSNLCQVSVIDCELGRILPCQATTVHAPT